ncbi:hypothetical protein Tco_0170211 [Tanacetum coccineum]
MENSKRGSIPMQDNLRLSKSQGASTLAELKRMQNVPYASAMGSIMYVVRCTRPDVAFAQNITSRLQQNPGDLHWTTVKNILKVSCYTNAGYLMDVDDLNSQTGYVFVLNGGAVDWKSTKQSIFATSSAEAEYIAAYDASKEAVWVRKFIYGLGVVPAIEEPINMYCDNIGAITIANESRITKGARHFCAKVHYLREVIEFGDIKLEKVHTYDNLADPFTKALAFPKHSEHTSNIGMLPASSLIVLSVAVNILKSIDEGPFQMGTIRNPIAEGTEGAQQLGPERARVYSDLSPEDKDRYNADIRATNILLQGLPKGICTLINHYIEAKDIWDNMKMLLEGSELTKEDRESQLYDDFEHFRQNKGETIHDYYVRFAKLINDMRNIKMTMSRMQLNSKFVNSMLPEWGRFVIAVKLNRGLRDSNYDQLYAYLKQHEAHANENKMMLDRFTQHTVDPLVLMSNVSQQQYYSQSSTTPPSTHLQPHFADNTQLDSRLSPMDNLIENLTNTLALLTQSYKTYLPQTNNQLRTSSNTRNQAIVQDGRVVVQNVQLVIGDLRTELNMQIQLKQGRLSATTATENGVALDEEQLLFIASGQDTIVDEDVDEQPVQDLALNVDNVFQADDCDAFDSDVDEAPTAQTMFMANLSSADPVYDEAGPSYDSDILSEVHDNDHYQDAVCEHHEVHKMHDDVQPNYVVDSHTDYTSDSNMIPYDQYVKDNAMPVVQSNVSSNNVVDNSLTAELATYKEQVELYERRAKFELTEREQKINEQLRIVIADRNRKEENLKRELHSVKLQLTSTINHNKSMVEEVTSLKKDFKQKENKYLEEFLDMKALKEKVKDKLYKQDQSLQTVHMCVNQSPIMMNRIRNLFSDFQHPQKQWCSPTEQIFWSKDLIKMKAEALKEQTTASRPIKALMMYPPNTPATLVPQHPNLTIPLRCPDFRGCYIANDNLIADCLSKEVFYIATNFELTVSRFTEMHAVHTVVQVNHLNLQLKYQNLIESFGNNTSPPARDAPDFDSVFVIEKMKASIQGKDNAIKKLRMQISQLNETRSETDRTLDFRALDFQITQLTNKVTVLQEQNELFRTENAKIKPHYKELYDSIKIMRAKHIEQTTALLTENKNLKAQIHENVKYITMDSVQPRVLATGRYAIDVEPIPPRNRNNREVHLDYLK